MLGHGAIGQFAIGQAAAPETVTLDKWFMPLSEPVRFRPGMSAWLQQSLAFNPQPFVSFSWFEALSEPPVKHLQGLTPAQQQFTAFHPAPSPFVATGWYVPLSEPPRFKLGLAPPRQQFLAAPSRLLPTPTVFGVLAATETKDTFLGSAREWNRVTSGEIGVIEAKFTGAQIGVVGPVIATARVSIRII